MLRSTLMAAVMATTALLPPSTSAQSTEPPPVAKVQGYLPHMTRPEVEELLTRTDMVIIPVASLEQHGDASADRDRLPERRGAREADRAAGPMCSWRRSLLPGQSPYHMGFAGTVTLPSSSNRRGPVGRARRKPLVQDMSAMLTRLQSDGRVVQVSHGKWTARSGPGSQGG